MSENLFVPGALLKSLVAVLIPHQICCYCTEFAWWFASKMGEWLSTQIKKERKWARGEDYCKLRLAFQTFSPVKTLTWSIVYVPGRGLSELCISWVSWVSLDVIVALLNIHRWICGINSLVNWQRARKSCPWVSYLHLHFWETLFEHECVCVRVCVHAHECGCCVLG